MRLRNIALTGALALVCGNANAYLVSVDSSFGAGTLTSDTQTGLSWLDLTVTQGMSWSSVESAIQTDPAYQGFRFARSEDVETLLLHAGAVLPSIVLRPENLLPISNLMELVGVTHVISRSDISSTGVLSALSGLGDGPYGQSRNRFSFGVYGDAGQVNPSNGIQWYNERSQFSGSWLVKDIPAPVPEPETYAMLLSGLGLLGLTARRRKQKG